MSSCSTSNGHGTVSSDVWFSDGNVILRVGPRLFKVHRGQLARHSAIFRDMFSLPQPPGGEIMDGCDVLDLYDSHEDVACLLQALYDGLYFKDPHLCDFPAIASILRLATKYDIEHLRSRCLEQLQLDWPATIDGWDRREAYATDVVNHYNPRAHIAHPIFVINLARELDLDFLLPSAFYDLSRYAPSKIADGVRISSKSSPVSSPCSDDSDLTAYSEETPSQSPSATPSEDVVVARLHPHDLIATLRGREIGQRRIGTFIECELHLRRTTPDCENKDDNGSLPCRESFYFVMLNVLRSIGGIACGRDADPLFTLVQAVEMLGRTDFSDGTQLCGLRMCPACKYDLTCAVRRTREEIWVNLPLWFDLA